MAGTAAHSDTEDQLPQLGEWDGPVFGRLGVLADDGERVECHACGRWFLHPGRHVQQTHGLAADAYRAIFGLNRGTGLAGPAYRALARGFAKRNFTPFWPKPGEPPRSLTPEWRAAGHKRRRLEAIADPHNRDLQRQHARQGGAAVRQLSAEGRLTRRPTKVNREAALRGQARLQELLRDPEWKAEWRRKVSEGRGGAKVVEVSCIVCGTTFTVPWWLPKYGRGKVCASDVCRRKRKAEILASHAPTKRPEFRAARRIDTARQWRERQGYAEVAARLHGLGPNGLAALPDLDRLALQSHYGLDGGGPLTKQEVAAAIGRSRDWVRESLSRSLRCLFGATPYGSSEGHSIPSARPTTPVDGTHN